jgi:hypothetical protein
MSARILPLALASTSWLRLDRLVLRGRYDGGALPPAVFKLVRKLEIEISWREYATHPDPRGSADQPPNA